MVYIDNMNVRFGRMIMCHMVADTHEELIDMAKQICVNIKWIQKECTYQEHFDICLSMKKKALKLGATEITMKQLAEYNLAKAGDFHTLEHLQETERIKEMNIELNKDSNIF